MLFRLCATLVEIIPKYRRYYTPAQIDRAIRILRYQLEQDIMKHWRKTTIAFKDYGNKYTYKRIAEASKILKRSLNAALDDQNPTLQIHKICTTSVKAHTPTRAQIHLGLHTMVSDRSGQVMASPRSLSSTPR